MEIREGMSQQQKGIWQEFNGLIPSRAHVKHPDNGPRYPANHPTLDPFSIESDDDLGIPHFKTRPILLMVTLWS